MYDSTQENANWDKTALKWIAGTAARQRSDGTIDVSVQSSNDSIAWGNSLVINASGDKLVGLSPGRYLRISFVFNRDSSGASPVLYSVSLQVGWVIISCVRSWVFVCMCVYRRLRVNPLLF